MFFKVAKSQLRLAQELQGRSYDSMVAHISIVFARYIYLAMETRNEQDPRTLGQLFLELCDEMVDVRYADVICLLVSLIEQAIGQTANENMAILEEAVQHFIAQCRQGAVSCLRVVE